jgi:phosphotransferase system enzyme I (PtsI)
MAKNQTKIKPLQGLAVSPGIAIGKAYIHIQFRPDFSEQTIPKDWVEEELKRFNKATESLLEQFQGLKKRKDADTEAVSILKAQSLILKDPELCALIENLVSKNKYALEYAIFQGFQTYIDKFEATANANLIERIPDLIEIRDRLALILHGQDSQYELPDECILVAKDYSIHDLIKYSSRIKALVLEKGGFTSHLAIIAHSLGIPAVFGVKEARERIANGEAIAVDAANGFIWSKPNAAILDQLKKQDESDKKQQIFLEYVLNQPSITRCGKSFELMANTELFEEYQGLKKVNCNRIGLLRTETILIQNPENHLPLRQFNYYKQFLADGSITSITIRLFDAGGDKIISNYTSQERNPYLGWRGIRFLLGQEKLLRQQLYAVCKLSGIYPGRIKIMIPMVSQVEEVLAFKKHLSEVQSELENNNVTFDRDIPIGLMIEVPAAVLMSSELAKHVDFFSIGTNDLTQYTMAADRGNDLVSDLYQQTNPAVWKLIKYTADSAKNAALPISVCGELAANPAAAAAMLGLGITKLSMMPAAIPKVKNLLLNRTFSSMVKLANDIIHCSSNTDVERLLKDFREKCD